jgi:hypothetical protein
MSNAIEIDEEIIEALDAAWDDGGFLELLRGGAYDHAKADSLLAALQRLNTLDGAIAVNGRLIRLVWMMPIFIEWQAQALESRGQDVTQVRHVSVAVFEQLSRVLGVP